jgi:hypothetical protein
VFNTLKLSIEVFVKFLIELLTEILMGVEVSLIVYYLDSSVN